MTGNEPKYVNMCEYFSGDSMSFERLVEISEKMNTSTASTLEQGWNKLGSDFAKRTEEFDAEFTKTLDEAWTGSGAQAAKSSFREYVKSTEDSESKFKGVSGALADIVAAVKAVTNTGSGIPEYISKGGVYNTLTPWDTDTEDEYHRRHGQALTAISLYTANLGSAETPVPQFPKLETKMDTGNPNTPGGPGGTNPGGPGGGNPSTGNPNTGDPKLGEDPNKTGDPKNPGNPNPDAPSLGDKTPGSPTTGIPGAPQLGDPAGTSAMAAGGPAGGGAGMGGGGGGLGGGAGAGGGLGAAPGAGIAGGAAGGAGLAGGAAGGAAAGRGMGMGGGMMGGGAGGRGGDKDKEHKTADYLVTLENGNELIGKMPPMAPPVIGA
ncbi:MAG: hypothetical protein GX542_12205 [Rhodococcus sp.]|nr:hypothetical protein [Rhodococcus sp. (in: high G+C Gram-positive bacteria)]